MKDCQALVSVNEQGRRIGQDHPRGKLTDAEVESLIRDRGPEEAPEMSYSELATKWGISKSGVRDLLTGRRRGQAKRMVVKVATNHVQPNEQKVRVDLRVTLRARAILHRLGGGKVIEHLARIAHAELRRAPNEDANIVLARLMKRIGGVK